MAHLVHAHLKALVSCPIRFLVVERASVVESIEHALLEHPRNETWCPLRIRVFATQQIGRRRCFSGVWEGGG